MVLDLLRAGTHLNNGRALPDFPFLRGKKIGPLWLRMLRDNGGLSTRNLEAFPIPVDIHVARASLAVGLVRGQFEGKPPIFRIPADGIVGRVSLNMLGLKLLTEQRLSETQSAPFGESL